jgi:hypothetical protein
VPDAENTKSECQERSGRAIVQGRLSGEGETQGVAIGGPLYFHVGCQHRIADGDLGDSLDPQAVADRVAREGQRLDV